MLTAEQLFVTEGLQINCVRNPSGLEAEWPAHFLL
jgi:hypothetical protein